MENLNRRDVLVALTAFAALGSVAAEGQAEGEQVLSKSKVYPFEDLAVKKMSNGGESRQVLAGVLPTGEYLAMHETVLPAGQMPHPPHKHRNSELLCIQEGKLTYYNDGVPEPVGPGGVIFTASNVMHGLKNVGDTPAKYFVIEISRGAEKA
jgi:quercetin dioxygenase-like cupin family protein